MGIDALAARAERSDWITDQLRMLRQEWSLLTIHGLGIPRRVRVHAGGQTTTRLEEVEQWLPNFARNANKPTPVASAITTKKVNAPRRLASMRVLKHATSHQKTSKVEVRYHYPEQVSAPLHDKGVRKITVLHAWVPRQNSKAQLKDSEQLRHLPDLTRRAAAFSSRPPLPATWPCCERFPRCR